MRWFLEKRAPNQYELPGHRSADSLVQEKFGAARISTTLQSDFSQKKKLVNVEDSLGEVCALDSGDCQSSRPQ